MSSIFFCPQAGYYGLAANGQQILGGRGTTKCNKFALDKFEKKHMDFQQKTSKKYIIAIMGAKYCKNN